MARVSRAQTDKNRVAIEQASSRLFREQGIDAVSVADLMAAAGLTHGGFYGHFASKDALAAVACTSAFDEAVARWRQRIDAAGDDAAAARAIAAGFLSRDSRDDRGTGCPAVGLAADCARAPDAAPVRAAYRDGIAAMLATLTPLAGDGEAARQHAIVMLAALVGAQTLARATAGAPLSDEILTAMHAMRDVFLPPGPSGPSRTQP